MTFWCLRSFWGHWVHLSENSPDYGIYFVDRTESQRVPQIILPSTDEPPQAIEPQPKEKRMLHDPDHGLNLDIVETIQIKSP